MTAAPCLAGRPRSSFRLATDRSFGPFFWGLLGSNIGTWFHQVAVAIVIYDITGSTLAVAMVSAVQFGAVLVVAPIAGWLADRADRRVLLTWTLACSALGASCIGVVSALGALSPMWIYVATGLLGIGNAGTHPILQAVMPSLVPPADLPAALGLHSVSFNLARAVGPVLGAASLVAFGPTASFAIDAVTYVLFIAAVASIPALRASGVVRRGRGAVTGGFRFAGSDPVVLTGLVAVAAVGWASDPVQTFVPAIADELDREAGTVGTLISLFGAGAVVMAVNQGRLIAGRGGDVAGAAGLAVQAAFLAVLATGPGFVATAVAFAGCGAGFMLAITGITTAIQLRVPEATRGRVMALWSMAFLGTRPLTSTLNGVAADRLSLGAGLVIPSVAAILAAAAIWRVGRADRAGSQRSGLPSS